MEKLKKMSKLFFDAYSVVCNVLQKPLRFSIYVNEVVVTSFSNKKQQLF